MLWWYYIRERSWDKPARFLKYFGILLCCYSAWEGEGDGVLLLDWICGFEQGTAPLLPTQKTEERATAT